MGEPSGPVPVDQRLVELGEDQLVLGTIREPLGCNDVGQVRDRYFDPTDIHYVGVTGEIVVAPAGRFKCDIEGTEGALEVPHLGPTEGDRIVGEGEALGYRFGADPSTQLGESGREPFQVVGVGRRGEIDVLSHIAFDIGRATHPPITT